MWFFSNWSLDSIVLRTWKAVAADDAKVPTVMLFNKHCLDAASTSRCMNQGACNNTAATGAGHQCTTSPNRTCNSSGNAAWDANSQCSTGYQGNLCGVGAVGHGTVKPFTCRACMSAGAIIELYLGAAVVLLLIMVLLCYFTLAVSRQQQPPAELLKPLVLYMQYLLVVASMGISWPPTLACPLQALAWVWSSASPETLSIDCLLKNDHSAIPLAMQKVLFYLIMPLAMLLLLLLVEWAMIALLQSKAMASSESIVDRLLKCATIAVFFFLPSVLRVVFGMFACVQLDSDVDAAYSAGAVGSFWVYDMQQVCFEGWHKSWSSGLGLPLYVPYCPALSLPHTDQ